MLCVRRVQMQPQLGRGDFSYIIFEQGHIAKPFYVLNDYQMGLFMEECENEKYDPTDADGADNGVIGQILQVLKTRDEADIVDSDDATKHDIDAFDEIVSILQQAGWRKP
jgi:hypothetical protein